MTIAADSQAVRSCFADSSQEFRPLYHPVFSGDPKDVCRGQSKLIISGRNVCSSGDNPYSQNDTAEKRVSEDMAISRMIGDREMYLHVWLLSLMRFIARIALPGHFYRPPGSWRVRFDLVSKLKVS